MTILRGCRLRPVEAVQMWLAVAEIGAGPVFRAVALAATSRTLASPTASPVAS